MEKILLAVFIIILGYLLVPILLAIAKRKYLLPTVKKIAAINGSVCYLLSLIIVFRFYIYQIAYTFAFAPNYKEMTFFAITCIGIFAAFLMYIFLKNNCLKSEKEN